MTFMMVTVSANVFLFKNCVLVSRPKKYLHAAQDETYKQGVHEMHGMQALADEVCRYDLDGLDMVWLTRYNELRSQWGEQSNSL